jgi:tRNA U34 5-methylaminomethyl-2-thiouridine-forming methyltransferase MnmC
MELLLTNDGSHTLHHPTLNETYHSKFGAVEESKYVFLEKGLGDYLKRTSNSKQQAISILEIGYGTGLNALLFADYAIENKIKLQYTGIDILPLSEAILTQLNYSEIIPLHTTDLFQQLNLAAWNVKTIVNDYFEINKIQADIHDFDGSNYLETIDLVLMDAFAPDKQPDMWQNELFCNLFSIQKPGGILVTYTSKGAVKRSLIQAGYVVEKLPGPPMKRHMLRATKPLQNETV